MSVWLIIYCVVGFCLLVGLDYKLIPRNSMVRWLLSWVVALPVTCALYALFRVYELLTTG